MKQKSNRLFVLGMGCERRTLPEEAIALAEDALQLGGIEATQLVAVASIDNRAHEPAILAVAAHFSVEPMFFPAARLEEETPRLKNPSELVFAHVGCHGVAESAALAAAGAESMLVVEKIKSASATAALAKIAGKL